MVFRWLPGPGHSIPALVFCSRPRGHSVAAQNIWQRHPVGLHVSQFDGYISHLRNNKKTNSLTSEFESHLKQTNEKKTTTKKPKTKHISNYGATQWRESYEGRVHPSIWNPPTGGLTTWWHLHFKIRKWNSPGVRSSGRKWQNTNQLVHFAWAWLHFVFHHNFHSLEGLVRSAATTFVPEFAACLEQLCQQRATQMQRRERKMWAGLQMNVLATCLPRT